MSRDILIGIDAGTSVIKAVAFDLADGREIGCASRPNLYESRPDGAVEQDMARTWADTAAVLAELAERIANLPARAAALAVTGQGDGTWLVDRAGEPAAPGWLWLDSRAARIVRGFERDGVRQALYERTGCGLNACNMSAQLVWMKRNTPDVLARADSAMHCKDWLYFKLTGIRATDPSEAIFTFGDFRSGQYDDDVLAALGLDDERRLLPDIVDGSVTTHPLSDEAARQTGLPAGLPVALGFVDIVCTGLGGGAYAHGRKVGLSIVGSTGIHLRLFDRAEDMALPPEPSGYTIMVPIPGMISRIQTNMAATLNVDWIVGIATQGALLAGNAADRATMLSRIDESVLTARPGSAVFHPYIHHAGERGPFLDAFARAQFTGLTADVTLPDLARAVYEGLALASRDCYGALGEPPAEIRIAGGAARSTAFKRILASALGRPVREGTLAEAGAAGAAMMAGVAIGAFAGMDEAVAAWVDPTLTGTVEPDPELAGLYDRLFDIYRTARQAMPPIWEQLAGLRAEGHP
ncbi:FGGY family carbohydrate kinase [Marinivivus vitaminiproducens]|uniref:FGGY family carbohydrate kinase n=1 Tax=Marinivivus vitaminiproducens TaxID=3035935 RepID=UPI0027AA3908|nr:carbohydrate kinase [Geminicoccaceae bacterium SCSIO 64248]